MGLLRMMVGGGGGLVNETLLKCNQITFSLFFASIKLKLNSSNSSESYHHRCNGYSHANGHTHRPFRTIQSVYIVYFIMRDTWNI